MEKIGDFGENITRKRALRKFDQKCVKILPEFRFLLESQVLVFMGLILRVYAFIEISGYQTTIIIGDVRNTEFDTLCL